MTIEQIKIDEKHTYQFDQGTGHVQILRHGEPWLGEERGGFPGSKAWISAANEIERLRARLAELEATPKPQDAVKRMHSRSVTHLKEDMEASLRFALGDDYEAKTVDVRAIVGAMESFDDTQTALLDVKDRLGTDAFGQVLLYHLDNRTSLMGQSEVLTSGSSLAELGMTVADLGWPNTALHPKYRR